MKSKYDHFCIEASKMMTHQYSTSFSLGIRFFSKDVRKNIYAIYGFVRLFDEIVDSFYDFNHADLFYRLKKEYHQSLIDKISTNPVLNAFQEVVLTYKIQDLVEEFIKSMEYDLEKNNYTQMADYEDYIYGSADVVGLMCLKVFVNGDEAEYERLCPYAKKLGSAFQKVNFLRDLKYDKETLGRKYFPHIESISNFSEEEKKAILLEIKDDFKQALIGIKQLPKTVQFGVYLAYQYYQTLLYKLNEKPVEDILNFRIRINNFQKFLILNKSYLKYKADVL